jgi:hypothetical protein
LHRNAPDANAPIYSGQQCAQAGLLLGLMHPLNMDSRLRGNDGMAEICKQPPPGTP